MEPDRVIHGSLIPQAFFVITCSRTGPSFSAHFPMLKQVLKVKVRRSARVLEA